MKGMNGPFFFQQLCLLDYELKTSLISVDAAAEVRLLKEKTGNVQGTKSELDAGVLSGNAGEIKWYAKKSRNHVHCWKRCDHENFCGLHARRRCVHVQHVSGRLEEV